MSAAGYRNIRYGKAKGSDHTIVFADKENETFIFDPILAHWDPISFSDLTKRHRLVNEGYPIINGRYSTIITQVEQGGIEISKTIDDPPFISKQYFYSGTTFDLEKLDDIDIAINNPENLFYLLCQSREGIERVLTYNFVRRTFRIRVSGGSDMVSVIRDSSDFERHLKVISQQTNISGPQIKNYMVEAGKILCDLRQRVACAV